MSTNQYADNVMSALHRIYQANTPPSVDDILELGRSLRAFGTGTIIMDTESPGAVCASFRGAILASVTNQDGTAKFITSMLRAVQQDNAWQQARGWIAKFARNIRCEIEARKFPPALAGTVPAGADGPTRKTATTVTVRRNPKDRDNYIYFAICDGMPLKEIRAKVNANDDWQPLDHLQSVSAAARRFAKKHSLPWPIAR